MSAAEGGINVEQISTDVTCVSKNGNNNYGVTKSLSEVTISDDTTSSSNYKDPLRQFHPSTSVIMAGYRSDLSEAAIKAPVFRSSTFEFKNAQQGELFFQRAYNLPGSDCKKPGLVYSRLNNPNTEIFEDKMVALEKGAGYASAFPSGMSAISTTILALVGHGGHIVYSSPVYGGTYFFLKSFCPNRFGITTTPIDTSDISLLQNTVSLMDRLDALFLETPANPTLRMTDIELAASIVRTKFPNVIIMVDNTLLGPVFQAPFLHGADIVLYSATKFLGGHSDLLAGVALTKSDDMITKINEYRTILGPVVAPDTCWMLTRSLETVWLRMERQASKATTIAAALANHPNVEKVLFPGFYSSETSTVARAKQMTLFEKQCTGTGSMITIIVKPNTREAAYMVLNNLTIAHLAVSLGSTETLIQHPRSMTHSDMTIEDLEACGITEGMIRISVGLESTRDLIADLLSALDCISSHNQKGNTM